MRYYEIIEARRNPEQNPKVSTLDTLEKYAGRKDVFVSFTSDVGEMSHINTQDMYLTGFGRGKNTSGSKLGINPKSSYNTPIGIYTYPIDYVISRKGRVPFAAEEPFLYVVQATKPLLDLNNYSKSDFERDSKKLIDMGFASTRNRGITSAKFNTPAAHIWNWTRFAARENIARWSKILRSLGYSGAVDHGSKLIHENEDTQAVFFNINAIKVLEVIPNRFKRKPLNKSIGDVNNPNEYVQLAAVQKNGMEIKHIDDPSEAVQLEAVTQLGDAIQYIIEKGITPSEQVQMAAVQQDGYAIDYVENPSEEVQLAAVLQNGAVIENIIERGITPSEKVQLAAVSQNRVLIQYIENPSEKVQLAAVTNDIYAIDYIENPSEAVMKAAGL